MKQGGRKAAGRKLLGVVIGSVAAAAWGAETSADAEQTTSALPVKAAKAGDAARNTQTLESVVVTAQKRLERLQDVPASITAITGTQIEQRGMDEFTDYARTVPGLSFIDRGPGKTKITLRGVSSGVTQDNQSPVGVYFDEMPVSFPSYNPDLRLFDIDRIEILRGPQGTLYGAGSMGGTIKVVTNKPELNLLEGALNGVYSRTTNGSDNWRLNAMLNVPVSQDKAALRFVYYKRDDGGFIDNTALGATNVNRDRTEGGRFSGRWVLTPDLELLGTATVQHTNVGGTPEMDAAQGDLKQSRKVQELSTDDFNQYNVTVNYNLGWAKLVSSSSWFDRRSSEGRDVSNRLAFVGLPVGLDTLFPTKRFTQEFRLVSPTAQQWEWIAGAFYLDQRDQLVQHMRTTASSTPGLLDTTIHRTQNQSALFGEVSYRFTDQLKGTVGLRWFDVRQTFDLDSTGMLAGGHRVDGGVATESNVNPKFLLSYQASPSVLLYTQAAQGFRVGGTNNTLPPDPATGVAAPSQYKSDSLWNYEIGAKTEFWERRASLNASLYYIDWTGIQVTIPRSDGFSFIGNAGKAVSKGMELEFAMRVTNAFQMAASLSYTDARLTKDEPGLGGLSGDRIPAVPRLTGNLLLRYEAPIAGELFGFAQADLQHVGESYNAFNAAKADLQGAYNVVNLRFGVSKDKWEGTFFIDNAFDTRATLLVDTALSDKRIDVNRPRTVGVSMTYRY